MNNEQVIAVINALGKEPINPLVKPANEVRDVIDILRAYQDDRDNFTKYAASRNYAAPNLDKWYHPASMYDATKGNLFRGLVALNAGLAKEGLDFIKYTRDTYNPLYAGWEGIKDLARNLGGVGASLFNPNTPVEENNWIKNLQTPTMRDIMPEYRSKHGKIY